MNKIKLFGGGGGGGGGGRGRRRGGGWYPILSIRVNKLTLD